jgi:hypothetical protein
MMYTSTRIYTNDFHSFQLPTETSAASTGVRAAHNTMRERTAVLRVLLTELRRIFHNCGVVAPMRPYQQAPAHPTPGIAPLHAAHGRHPAQVHTFVRASGQATAPRSTTAKASLAVGGDPDGRARQGLEGTVTALFRDVDRCLTGLEMDLDAADAGVTREGEPGIGTDTGSKIEGEGGGAAADAARHLLKENERARDHLLAADITRQRHAALQAQMGRLQEQVIGRVLR